MSGKEDEDVNVTEDELWAMIEDLQQQVAERDAQISELSQDTAGKKKRKGNDSYYTDKIDKLEKELEELQDRNEREARQNSKLKEELSTAESNIKSIAKEKAESDKKLKEKTKEADTLKKEVLDMQNKQRSVEQQSRDFSKQKTMNIKETKQLSEELEAVKEELSLKDQEFNEYKAKAEAFIVQRVEEVDDLKAENEKLVNELAELEGIERDFKIVSETLAAAQDKEAALDNELEEARDELRKQQTKASKEQKAAETELAALKAQIAELRNSSAAGEKQRMVESLKNTNKKLEEELKQTKADLAEAEEDRAELAESLQELRGDIETRAADRVAAEKGRNNALQGTIDSLRRDLSAHEEEMAQLEKDKQETVRELDELKYWKSVYESGHGLQEMAKSLKKVKDDNRRLTVELQQANEKHGILMDAHAGQSRAFSKLKEETGKGADFSYSDVDIRQEVMSTNDSLKAQLDDANEGIALLEAECTQLRNALKKQAEASKVKGNAAIDLSTIDELSAANARARELSKENAKLKEELEKQKSKLERVERELGGKLSGQPLTMITSSGAPSDVARLMQENAEMHRRMDALQSELIDLVKHNNAQVEEKLIMSMGSQSALPAGATEEQKKLFADTKRASLTTAANQEVMVAMLARNNEMLLQEIQELKRHYQQPRIFPPHQQTEVIADRKTGKSLSLEKTSPSPSMHPPLHPTTPQVNQQNLNTTFASGGSSMWTPGIGRGGMPFFSTTNTPVGMGGFQSVGIGAGPQTPQGKMLLANTLTQLNLPPEEWALDVRDLNSQLVECLEQLYEREEELEEQRGLVSALEDNLVMIKEQMAALYHDYALRSSNWETKEHKFKSELKGLLEDRDDLRLKLRRMHELSESLKQSDATSMQAKISELTRKVTIYEVNEAVLSRKYTSQAEQLQLETEKMQRLQVDFVEMESSLKKRILYLEQYKLSAGSRLAQIQGKLDVCVPQEDYKALLSEIEVLREDHLNTLRREVEAKMSAMNSLDQARELRSLRLMIAQVRADYDASRASVLSLQAQLEHQKLTTEKALKAAKSSAEMTSIISELARFRGETARLEVEQVASSRRVDYLSERLEAVTKEADKYSQRVQELEKREEDAAAKESAAKKMVLEMQLKFEAGLTKDEADNLRSKLEKVQQQFEETQREVSRQRELAEIASLQAETIGSFRGQHASELKELREYCAKLESRSEDELLIGRLQRQLISTKTSYKSFVRKYQLTRDNLRKRELAMRILEAELDSRTNEGSSLQEALRKEIESLKKALRDMKNSVLDDASSDRQPNRGSKPTKPSSARMVRMGDKLLQVSSKVNELAELAEDSVNRTIEMEGECRRLQGLLQDVESDKHHYKQQVADLTSIVKGHSKQQVVASRLVSLSEDLRVSKLNSLQQRRQIEVLRKEKRHLQSVITNMEADVLELEEGKVLAETKSVLFADGESTAFKSSAENGYGEIKEMQEEFIAGQQQHQPHPEMARSSSQGLTINTALEDEQAAVEGDTASQLRAEGISAEDLFEKLQQSHNQLVQSRKQASEYKLQASNFASRLSEFEAMLEEARGQIAYYERVLAEEGMPTVLLRDPHYVLPGNNSNHVTSRHYRMRQEEQEKLQEAASATIGSLRSLLEEKNRVLEKYREKLEFLQQSAHIKSRADRRAEELLEKIDRDEANRERNAGSVVKEDYSSEELRKKLTEQIEQADSIIADKDRTIAQLEQKLLSQINQRERAENRCGESIKEMEAMKEDMVTLMKQLQDSEERAKHVTKAVQPQVAVADVSRVRELEKLLKSKVEKVRGYREIIIKLKDEFIKSEEERAAVQLRQQMDRGESSGGGAMTADELRDLKDKVKDLHDGLRQAKDDLSRAKKVREKLTQERDAAVEELKTFETRLFKSEAASKNAQDSQQHLRKELEDSRKKEFRMREKLKEYLSANESTTAKLRDLETAQERVKFLERELEFLQTQNIALRKDLKLSDPGTNSRGESKGEGDRKALGELNNNALRAGYVLGVGNGPEFADTALDLDTRKQMHARWETDKKSSKRMETLEKRLKEKIAENEQLVEQLRVAQDAVSAASHAKDELQKRVSTTTKQSKEAKKNTADDVMALEEAHATIYSLEGQLLELRRKAEVDQVNDINALSHQVSTYRAKISELEAELADSEQRRKRLAAEGGTAKTLRDSEDRFLREEKLKDDLDFAIRQKLELESALLERDARAIEQRFEIEASELEIDRLKRRVKELEAAYRGINAVVSSGPVTVNSAKGKANSSAFDIGIPGIPAVNVVPGGGNTKRERELEGVVEAMKRVIDKLKTENDRYKKTGGTEEKRLQEFERRWQNEKKRADKLEEESKSAASKLKLQDESSQRIIQKQQQVASLRKQLKAKDDELASIRENYEANDLDRGALKAKVNSLEDKVQQLQISLEQARVAAKQAAAIGSSNNSANVRGGAAGGTMTAEQKRELDNLRSKFEEQNEELKMLRSQLRDRLESSGYHRQMEEDFVTKAEYKRIRDENERLKQELSAFDLDFFEEIENLKFAHAEAMRKLRMYEDRAGGTARR